MLRLHTVTYAAVVACSVFTFPEFSQFDGLTRYRDANFIGRAELVNASVARSSCDLSQEDLRSIASAWQVVVEERYDELSVYRFANFVKILDDGQCSIIGITLFDQAGRETLHPSLESGYVDIFIQFGQQQGLPAKRVPIEAVRTLANMQ